MKRVGLILLAAAMLFVDGLVYGRWTDRWGQAQAVEEAVAHLERIPLQIGSWTGKPLSAPEEQARRSGCAGIWVRHYERSQDGAAVNVMLACGRPGPLAVHTPDICYVGSGYVQAEAPVQYAAPAQTNVAPAMFWKSRFSKPDALVPLNLRLLWSWYGKSGWQAPGNPRIEFAGSPALYKLYVIREMDGRDDQRDDAICREFLAAFLPAFDATMPNDPQAVQRPAP